MSESFPRMLSSFLCRVHFWQLLGLALAEGNVAFASCFVEFTATDRALDHAAGFLGLCLFLSCQLLTSSSLKTRPEGSTLLLPLRNLPLLLLRGLAVFCFLLADSRWYRRDLGVLAIQLSKGC
jgi:hypothetical protein